MQAAIRQRLGSDVPQVSESCASMKRQISAAISDASVGALYSRDTIGIHRQLDQVTGEPGDIMRDDRLAYGDSALTFEDVGFCVKERSGGERPILEPVSGHFEPGTLVALMGPSGCGKTSLLDILADKKSVPYSGSVHLNGRPRDGLFRRLTSYVPQDDIMFAKLTVKETVMFHAALKNEVPSGVTSEMLEKATQFRLSAVGLEEVQDSFIGSATVRGISGGQRRRVSLACGLARAAQIIFLDEPTSGLSATDAEKCARFMRLVAKKYGVTIIVAIHQPRPEVAQLFDHLLLLTAKPGRVVYNGSLREAPQYWSDAGYSVPDFATPTDYFLDMITPDVPDSQADHFVAYYKAHQEMVVSMAVKAELANQRKTALQLLEDRRENLLHFGHIPAVRNSVFGVRFRRQLTKVFWRQLVLNLRDQQGLCTELLIGVVKALVVGMAYIGIGKHDGYSQVGFFFMVVTTCALDGIKVMPRAIQERTIMKLETSEALYSDWAYIIPFTIINSVISFAGNTIFLALVFVLSQLEWKAFPVLWWWSSLVFVSMESLYLMVAAIAKDGTAAQILLVPFIMIFLIYNGFTVSRNSVPSFMAWALDISPVARAMEEVVFGIQEVTGDTAIKMTQQMLGFESNQPAAIGVIVGWLIVFRIVQIICLRMLNNIQR